MSATRTFSTLTGSGPNNAYIPGDKWSAQVAEKVRNDVDIANYLGLTLDLGGDEDPILSASYVRVNCARSASLNGDTLSGMTLEAVVYYYTTNASTTVNVRVRNVTDSTDAGTITAASNATTLTEEVITLTLASGVKSYQLQVTGSDAVNGVIAYGYIRIRKVAA